MLHTLSSGYLPADERGAVSECRLRNVITKRLGIVPDRRIFARVVIGRWAGSPVQIVLIWALPLEVRELD
jgi:hypothetical protein